MIRKHFYLTNEQHTFLDGLDGLTTSENIRRAIDSYIAKRKKTMVSRSPSKPYKERGEQHG